VTGEHPGVFEVTGNGNFVPVLNSEKPVSLTFSADGATLYALDAGTHTVSEVAVTSGLTRSWSAEEIADPVGIETGRDLAGSAVVYVAGHNDRLLAVYSAASHELMEQISLEFAPMQLQPLASGYLLTARSSQDELLWSYAVGRGVFFVPVTPLEDGTAGTNEIPKQRKVRR
jgi:hypothetical protein